MKREAIKVVRLCAGIILLSGLTAFLVTSPLAGEERNPLKEEMAGLDLAFKEMIDAVVLGDLSLVPPAVEKAREARGKRDEVIRAGYPLRLPKNPNREDEFNFFDRKFQADLVEMARAAETGQKRAIRNHVHKLLDACLGCHERFRK